MRRTGLVLAWGGAWVVGGWGLAGGQEWPYALRICIYIYSIYILYIYIYTYIHILYMKTVRNKYAFFKKPAFIDLDVVGEAGGPADNPDLVMPTGVPIS